MKLKEINRTAIQSWSPAQHHPIYLATGTSAQQLDASFSTNASLEFFELDLTDLSLGMKSCGSLASSHRYHKLVWGPYGMESGAHPSGVLVAGGENGNVILYDPAKIMAGGTDVIIAESSRHNGPVRALDINPFQTNLVASGGNESEIYIWDMNNFGSPMTPGPKSQPLEDISCVAWNRQVQHILASASPGGRASVWDLRKNDLIIKVSDHSNRMHCSGLAWNPEVATQLVLASEDDRMPVIQMWDLRFATSPLKILENHTLGILSIAWSLADPELLLSCGKDSRILCWNPNTGEILYELPTSSQWCFDIQWCPRNPAVLSAAGFDGHIDIYSIMGGSSQAQSQRHADQISTSFGNMDPFGTGQTLPPLQLPQTVAPAATVTPLKKPPKWIRRPVGASFGFGGKLVSLENSKPNPQQPQQPTARVVHVSQVVTETDFLKRSDQLQATLSAGSFVDFCQGKIESCENEFEKTVWSFLKANFESDIRSRYLELLGYDKEELALKISAALEEKPADPPQIIAAPVEIPAEPPQILSTPEEIPVEPSQFFEESEEIPAEPLQISAETEEIPVEPPQVDLLPPASLQPLPDLSFLPPLDTPEAAFDMIAAANLLPAATLELDSTPDPEPEDPAATEEPVVTEEPEELEAVDLEDVPIIETEEIVDEILLDEKEEEEEEDFFLDEGEGAPVEEVPIPAEIAAPVEEPTEAPAPPADPDPAPPADLAPAPAPALIEEPVEIQAPVLIEEPFEIAEPVSAPSPIPAPAPAPTPAQEGAVSLSVSQDIDGLITQALLTGDFEGAVELCLHDNRMADSIILAIAGGPELLEKTQKKYFINTHSKITKLISAVVMKDWHDVLTTCELQNWKEALAAVMTYAKPEEFSSLCDLLGGRLEGADDAHLQAQACLCYICAGNVEKLVSCWTRAQNGHSPLSLQDLVEKVVVLRRAVELTQQNGAAAIGILMAEKMSQYANLLASQGSLSTAITYLPDNTNQVAVQQLRDRLSRALGQAAAPAAPAAVAPVQPQRVQPQQPAPTPVQPGLQQPPYMPVQPAMVPQPSAATPAPAPAASAPTQQQYYQPVRAASTVTSWSNQTPTALPNVPPPPLQAEQQQVEPPNPMYGMPPSGSAAAPPPSSTPAYMYSHQYQRYPQVSQYPSGAGGAPIYHPLQYSSSSSAPLPPAEPPGFLSQYTQQPVPSHGAPRVYPGQPYSSQCLSSSPPSHPPFFPNAAPSSSSSSFPAPASCGATLQHGGPGAPVSYMPPPPPTASGVSGTQPDPELVPASRRTGPQNGWNDPPVLSRAPKKKQVPVNFTPPAPITAPIMTPLGADPQAQPAPPSGPPQAMMQGPPQDAQVPYSGLQQQPLAPPPMNPAMPKTSLEGAPGAPTGDFIQPLQSIPAEKIQKKPIPDEHLVLKTTFEGLIQKCLAVATDPQTKRKLDDATKRLEALYDKLREQTLSPAIVAGLHNMARSIESRSYTEGLNIHTHIVSSSNFSETSAFMPVLKVVLTQANKLGV